MVEVLSIIGPHAGETMDQIFQRKIEDIKCYGKTYWLIKSYKSKPTIVQMLNPYIVNFITPSTKGGAKPTSHAEHATQWSVDKIEWQNLDKRISPVTGKLDQGAYALVLNSLELIDESIDLNKYVEYNGKGLKFLQGASTLCAIRQSNDLTKIKSRYRKIVARGTLVEPYAVWLKN